MNAGSAGHALPVVDTPFAPAVEPSLASGGKAEGAHLAGFPADTILITAQKGSFQRITLKSSHRVLPSFVDCTVPLASSEARQNVCHLRAARCRRDEQFPQLLRLRTEISSNQCPRSWE